MYLGSIGNLLGMDLRRSDPRVGGQYTDMGEDDDAAIVMIGRLRGIDFYIATIAEGLFPPKAPAVYQGRLGAVWRLFCSEYDDTRFGCNVLEKWGIYHLVIFGQGGGVAKNRSLVSVNEQADVGDI